MRRLGGNSGLLAGAVVDSRTLLAGQSLTIPQGAGACIVKGTFPGSDTTPPSPVFKFTANPGNGQNVLTWRNPSDTDFRGMKIVYRTDRYPTTASDGQVVCEKTGSPGASDQYTHTGLANGAACYYAAFDFNRTSIGTLDHSSAGAGDTLGRLRFESIDNINAAGHYLYFDDLRVGEPSIRGDFDHDEDVDQTDFGFFQRCISGDGQTPPEGCDAEDLDRDGDVDQNDFTVFQGCMGGSNSPPGC